MQKLAVIISTVLISVGGLSAKAAYTSAIVTKMHKSPSMGAAVVSSLSRGTKVDSLSTKGAWTEVKANGKTGFINKMFLSPIPVNKKVSLGNPAANNLKALARQRASTNVTAASARGLDGGDLRKLARSRASRNVTAASARGLDAGDLKALARSRASSNVTAASARGLDAGDLKALARGRASSNVTAASARGLEAGDLKALARGRASTNVTAASARGLEEEDARTRSVDEAASVFNPNTLEAIEKVRFTEESLLGFLKEGGVQ